MPWWRYSYLCAYYDGIWNSRGTAPHILNLGTRYWWVVSFVPWLHYPPYPPTPITHWIGGLLGPRKRRENLLPLLGTEWSSSSLQSSHYTIYNIPPHLKSALGEKEMQYGTWVPQTRGNLCFHLQGRTWGQQFLPKLFSLFTKLHGIMCQMNAPLTQWGLQISLNITAFLPHL